MIIDFHTHVFPSYIRDGREVLTSKDDTLRALYSNESDRMISAEELVSTMDGSGVDLSVVMGIGWTDVELGRISNDYLIESVRRFPKKLVGFCSVNPLWGPAALEEIERCADAGLVGIGELHPESQRFDLTDISLMTPIVSMALSKKMPILVHGSEPVGHRYAGKGNTTPEVLMNFIEHFPEVKIICAHWGGGLPFYGLMPEVLSALGNVFFDTAASPLLYRRDVFQVATDAVGNDKVILGTDYPLVQQNRMIRQVLESGISDDAKEGILYSNATRILEISVQ